MDGKKLGGILLAVALIGGALYLKFRNRGAAADDTLVQMQALIATIDGYQADQAYLKPLTERAHRAAFDGSYDIGGRRRRASFDEDKYLDAFFKHMIQACNADNHRDLVPALQTLRDSLRSTESSKAEG